MLPGILHAGKRGRHVPGLLPLSQLPVWWLSKVALTGLKLNGCQLALLCPPLSIDEAAPAASFSCSTLCVRTCACSTSHPEDSGGQDKKSRRLRVCPSWGWDTHPGCGSTTTSQFGFCGSLTVSLPIISFCILINLVVICFGTSHICFPRANPLLFLIFVILIKCASTSRPISCPPCILAGVQGPLPVLVPLPCAWGKGWLGFAPAFWHRQKSLQKWLWVLFCFFCLIIRKGCCGRSKSGRNSSRKG